MLSGRHLRNLSHRNQRKRLRAIAKVGASGRPDVVARLLGALRDWPPDTVKDATVEALIRVGPEAVPALIDALEGEAWGVTTCAARALGQLGGSEAGDALERALERRIGQLGANDIARALEDLGREPSTPADEARRHAAWQRWSQLEEMGEPAVPVLARIAESGLDWTDRWDAVRILAKIGGAAVVPVLETALGDPGLSVANAAAEALAKMRGQEAQGMDVLEREVAIVVVRPGSAGAPKNPEAYCHHILAQAYPNLSFHLKWWRVVGFQFARQTLGQDVFALLERDGTIPHLGQDWVSYTGEDRHGVPVVARVVPDPSAPS